MENILVKPSKVLQLTFSKIVRENSEFFKECVQKPNSSSKGGQVTFSIV